MRPRGARAGGRPRYQNETTFKYVTDLCTQHIPFRGRQIGWIKINRVTNANVCTRSRTLSAVADLQRGLGGPLHGPEGAGGPERAPGRRKFVGRNSFREENLIKSNQVLIKM